MFWWRTRTKNYTGGGGLDMFPVSTIPAGEPLDGRGTVHGDTLYGRQDAGGTPLPPHALKALE